MYVVSNASTELFQVASIRDASERAAVSTAVILVAFSNISSFVIPSDAQKLKEKVKCARVGLIFLSI